MEKEFGKILNRFTDIFVRTFIPSSIFVFTLTICDMIFHDSILWTYFVKYFQDDNGHIKLGIFLIASIGFSYFLYFYLHASDNLLKKNFSHKEYFVSLREAVTDKLCRKKMLDKLPKEYISDLTDYKLYKILSQNTIFDIDFKLIQYNDRIKYFQIFLFSVTTIIPASIATQNDSFVYKIFALVLFFIFLIISHFYIKHLYMQRNELLYVNYLLKD